MLIWEAATNKTEFEREPVSCKGHDNVVLNILFAPDNETFESASWDETYAYGKGRRQK
jgi:WD40 repeat protein